MRRVTAFPLYVSSHSDHHTKVARSHSEILAKRRLDHAGLVCRAYRPPRAHERLGDLRQAARKFRQPPELVDTTTFKEMAFWASAAARGIAKRPTLRENFGSAHETPWENGALELDWTRRAYNLTIVCMGYVCM